MALWRAVALTCLLAASATSSDEGYDPGYHGPGNGDADSSDDHTGFGAAGPHGNTGADGDNRGFAGNNEWTPIAGPSGGDRVYVDHKGAKTLVAGSPTSPVAEAIDFNPPPPPPPPVPIPSPILAEPHREHFIGSGSFHQTYQPHLLQPIPHRHPGFDVQSNLVSIHQGGHHIPTKTITNTIHVPVPAPYKVFVNKKVPFEVKVPVNVPVARPVQVPVPRPVSVPVDKPYKVILERKVPYEVRVPVQVPVRVPYPVDVPQPYPVHIAVPKPILIKHPVPVVIKIIKEDDRKGWWW